MLISGKRLDSIFLHGKSQESREWRIRGVTVSRSLYTDRHLLTIYLLTGAIKIGKTLSNKKLNLTKVDRFVGGTNMVKLFDQIIAHLLSNYQNHSLSSIIGKTSDRRDDRRYGVQKVRVNLKLRQPNPLAKQNISRTCDRVDISNLRTVRLTTVDDSEDIANQELLVVRQREIRRRKTGHDATSRDET